ncbi:hypothetical protein BV20DRAFT_1051465 [Pilatotrama ljubarskyi]|nr:hypothetical protein BV20DRAFT_1051465 [Pilatotrama ljubarskyi]
MSKAFRKVLGREEYSVVVAQFKTSEFGAGDEENLDWALVIIVDEDELVGGTYQAKPRLKNHYGGGACIVATSDREPLAESSRCLGGVRIGTINRSEVNDLESRILRHAPRVKSKEWTSRDWVMDCISIMQNRGWVPRGIRRQEDLFPGLKQASSLISTFANL